MWKQVTSGQGGGSLVNLKDYEDELAEGQRGKLSLTLLTSIPSDVVETLEIRLRDAGVAELDLSTSGNTLTIQFRKGFPWLAVIVGVVLGSIVLAALIVSWQFYKEVEKTVPELLIIVAVVVGVILMAVIAYAIARRQMC